MINSRLLLDYPYNQDLLATGAQDITKYNDQMQQHLEYLGLSVETITIIKDYAQSYENLSTLEGLKDYLIAKAYLFSLRSVLYKDQLATQTTDHVSRVIETTNRSSLFPVVNITNQRMAGPLGSLAYYFLFTDTNVDPVQCLQNLLSTIWGMIGIDYNLTPSQRIDKINLLTRRREYFDSQVQSLINDLFDNTSPGDEDYSLLLYARRNMLSKEDAVDFSRKILTGAYNPALLNVLNNLKDDAEDLNSFVSSASSLLRPVGFNLILQAFIVEGLLKAALNINSLPLEVTQQSLNNFLTNSQFSSARHDIASNLATSIDALQFINEHRLLDGYADEQDTLLKLTLRFTLPSIATAEATRLFNLVDTIDINKNNYIFTDNIYGELQKLSSVGSQSISLTADSNFTDVITYTAKLFNPVGSSFSMFFVLADNSIDRNAITVLSERVDNTANDATIQLTVSNQTGQPLVAAAATTNTNQGALVTLEDYSSLRNNIIQGNSTVSTSNVIVSAPNPVDDNISGQVDTASQGVFREYYNYNLLTATNSPRGSERTAYEAQGIYTSQLTATQITQLQLSKGGDYLDEYAARMAGLTYQQQQVHGQEITVLEEWSDLLRGVV